MRSWKFNHIDFSVYPFYNGDDLGVFYQNGELRIKIWAPSAQMVEFRIYEQSVGGEAIRIDYLKPQEKGCWHLFLKGQLEGYYYTFRVNDGEWLNEVPDMYARAVGANGKRGLIFDPQKTHPDDWETDRPVYCENPVDTIVYELHVRDFSIDPEAAFKHKGKYLAFSEAGLTDAFGNVIGLDHLVELGITHVHLLPVNDFSSVDEISPAGQYNWGYDPLHFNAPEGSYASCIDSSARIRELKQLVQALHRHGIGGIFDVVYNHTYYTRRSVFNQTVPGYFYRQNRSGGFSNASGCGNEIASERLMVRKYIVDSLCYWANEFHADGFRFDLMGILDLETMNQIRHALDEINPRILLYGEGWTADKSPLDEQFRAVKYNVSKLDRIAVFNDDLRNALKGSPFNSAAKGFVSGLTLREEQVKFGMVAACFHPQIIYPFVESSLQPWAAEPWQCVNYVSCHDNYSLYDKLKLSQPEATEDELQQMTCLAGAIILSSQGIPFLHGGVEMGRSKSGDPNSYRSSDAVNQIRWQQKMKFLPVVQYLKALIELRKQHPAFRMRSSEQIRKHLRFSDFYLPGVIAYSLNDHANGDSWEEILLVFNGNKYPIEFPLNDAKTWKLIAHGMQINHAGERIIKGPITEIPPVSMVILASV